MQSSGKDRKDREYLYSGERGEAEGNLVDESVGGEDPRYEITAKS